MAEFTEYILDRALSGDGYQAYDHAPGATQLEQATRRAQKRDGMRQCINVYTEDDNEN